MYKAPARGRIFSLDQANTYQHCEYTPIDITIPLQSTRALRMVDYSPSTSRRVVEVRRLIDMITDIQTVQNIFHHLHHHRSNTTTSQSPVSNPDSAVTSMLVHGT